MTVEHTQIKLTVSQETGELIGFVSRNPKSQKLMGVREDSRFGKKICILAKELKGTLSPNILYRVALAPMSDRKGYVIVSAKKVKFEALVEMFVKPGEIYRVTVSFGNKILYFDPKNGKSHFSNTVDGVVQVITKREDIENKEVVLQIFIERSKQLLARMTEDSHIATYKC